MPIEAPPLPPARVKENATPAEKEISTMLRRLSIDFMPGVSPSVREIALASEMRRVLKPLGFKERSSFSGQHEADIQRWMSKLSPEELKSFQTALWRGDAPERLMQSLLEDKPITLSPGFFNVADSFQTSIAYSGLESGGSEAPFNMCVGFEPKHMQVARRFDASEVQSAATNEAAVRAGISAVQESMMEGHGEIRKEDIKWIFARPHTGVRGTPGRILVFEREGPEV